MDHSTKRSDLLVIILDTEKEKRTRYICYLTAVIILDTEKEKRACYICYYCHHVYQSTSSPTYNIFSVT